MDIKSFVLGYQKGRSQSGGNTDLINDRLDAILGEVVGENQHTVTFVGADGLPLCSIIVVEGDDCADPVRTGLISKPTKTSTAQYTYSYSGWALSPQGTAYNNALKEITEDRTVYASFTATVIKYTVRFYDGDTLLKTEQISYGSSSTYTYEKEHYIFHGWSPEPTNITGDMDCRAQLEECYAFVDASWEYISDISARGLASEVFSGGDTRNVSMGGVDYQLTIADIGYDYIGEERGTNCITIICCVFDPYRFGRVNAWYEGELGTLVTSTIYNQLPSELKAVVKPAYKKYKDANYRYGDVIPSDYFSLWVPSVGEVKNKSSEDDERYTDRPYAIFTDATAGKNINVVNNTFWLRSVDRSTYHGGQDVLSAHEAFTVHIINGYTGFSTTIESDDVEDKHSVLFGFCV